LVEMRIGGESVVTETMMNSQRVNC
jgi:hypothetical protein